LILVKVVCTSVQEETQSFLAEERTFETVMTEKTMTFYFWKISEETEFICFD